MTKAKLIGYWTTTAILAFCWVAGGVADLVREPATLAGMVALGYPAYVLTILGIWKVLGAIAILVPRFPRLKEWAYAGTFFELTGAIASHAFAGSGVFHLLSPAFFLACAVASYALRPRSRTLGSPFPVTISRQWAGRQAVERRHPEPAAQPA